MNRKQLIRLGAAGALLISAGAWAKPQMTTDMAHDVNFADYHTSRGPARIRRAA